MPHSCPQNCDCHKKHHKSNEIATRKQGSYQGIHAHNVNNSKVVNNGKDGGGAGATRVDVYYFDHGNSRYEVVTNFSAFSSKNTFYK